MLKRHFITSIILLLFAISTKGQISGDLLIESFYQGKRNNCVSIALIKAAFNVFGPENVFKKVEQLNDTTWTIILKNDFELSLHSSELKKANISAGFIMKDSLDQKIIDLKNKAVFTYAVMAKYKYKNENLNTFDKALNQIENGATTSKSYKNLGLELNKNVKKLNRLSGRKKCGLVAWSPTHAVFACNGYIDNHGKRKKLWALYSGRYMLIK